MQGTCRDHIHNMLSVCEYDICLYVYILLKRNQLYDRLILSTWICHLIYLLGVFFGIVLVHRIRVNIFKTRMSRKKIKA